MLAEPSEQSARIASWMEARRRVRRREDRWERGKEEGKDTGDWGSSLAN